ncbi:MAG: hypothetical protein K8J31_09455, partial [Anaerolineae bacterium]|nr:hypothetical protein [Anaerolineae bacterium]
MWWVLLLGLLQPVTILPGTPVTVTLTANAGPVDVHYLAAGDEIVTITARSRAGEPIDVTLELLRDATHLAFNDDHLTEQVDLALQDAALVDLSLDEAGTYTLRVNSFSGAQSGDVEVRLESRPQIGPCALPSQPVNLRANRVFSCWLDLKAGQVVTLTARDTSGSLDPLLALD